MQYNGKHERANWRWAVVCWLLTFLFFGVSTFYGMQGSVSGWLLWLVLTAIWLYTAQKETLKYIKHNRNRTNA